METEIHQATENNFTQVIETESAATNNESDFFTDRDFGDEDAHDLFEV